VHVYQTEDLRVQFDQLPTLSPVLLSTRSMSRLRRFLSARKRRNFQLAVDWHVEITCKKNPHLSGTIVVPSRYSGKRQQFDGASIPFPWLVSAITLGVLRPLGILLTASIIHDFLFKYGFLLYRAGDCIEKRYIDRKNADLLFRKMIRTVNGLTFVAWVAYVAVRLGRFLSVPYARAEKSMHYERRDDCPFTQLEDEDIDRLQATFHNYSVILPDGLTRCKICKAYFVEGELPICNPV